MFTSNLHVFLIIGFYWSFNKLEAPALNESSVGIFRLWCKSVWGSDHLYVTKICATVCNEYFHHWKVIHTHTLPKIIYLKKLLSLPWASHNYSKQKNSDLFLSNTYTTSNKKQKWAQSGGLFKSNHHYTIEWFDYFLNNPSEYCSQEDKSNIAKNLHKIAHELTMNSALKHLIHIKNENIIKSNLHV